MKYLFLIPLFLAACGSDNSSAPVTATTTQTAQLKQAMQQTIDQICRIIKVSVSTRISLRLRLNIMIVFPKAFLMIAIQSNKRAFRI